MRALIPALAAATVLLTGSAALAAPTCLNGRGDIVRCGTAGAMPLGWTPPAGSGIGRPTGEADASDYGKLLGLTAFLAGVFGLIALMPDFEGKWDGQADDDERGG